MKAAIYLRQSLDRHGDELAVSRQREDCVKLCADRGWDWLEYIDNDTSASTGRRPDYQRMLTDIREGRLDAVVAWDLDRLYRQPRELEDLIDLADAKRLKLATVGGDADLSTDNGRLFARIKGAVARAEVERKGARQRRAAQQLAETGSQWWPNRAFGYDLADPSLLRGPKPKKWARGPVVLVEREAAALRDAYTGVLSGRSLKDIAREWNSQGLLTVKGGQWTGMLVKQVLISPRNAALRSYRGEIVGAADWPRVVEEDVWRGAVAMMADPARLTNGIGFVPRKYLLSALALCGCCGHTVSSVMPANTTRPRYSCKQSGCMKVKRSVADVDSWVTGLVVERLSRPDAADLLISSERVDLAALRDTAAALRARQDELAAQLTDLNIPVAKVKAQAADLAAQIAEVESKMLDANKSRIFNGLIGVADVRAKFRRSRVGPPACSHQCVVDGEDPAGSAFACGRSAPIWSR